MSPAGEEGNGEEHGAVAGADTRAAPVRPDALTWAMVMLGLSAVPLTVVYLDNFIASTGYSTGGPGSDTAGALLILNLVYLYLVFRLRRGYRGTRVVVTVLTILFDLIMVQTIVGVAGVLADDPGDDRGGLIFAAALAVLALATSIPGLILLWSRPVSDYVREVVRA